MNFNKITISKSNLLYVLFIISWAIGDVMNNVNDDFKYLFFFLHLIYMLLSLLFSLKRERRQLELREEFIELLKCYISFGFISILYQMINGQFLITTYKELFYMFFPIFYVFLLFNTNRKKNYDFYFQSATIIFCVAFVIRILPILSIDNILKISFLNSYSPFEGVGNADVFLILFIYYLFNNKKVVSTVLFFFCFLSFKRIHILFLIILIVARKTLIQNKKTVKVRKIFLYGAKIFFLVSPITIMLLTNNTFTNWFYNNTGLDFNSFTMGRLYTINYICDSNFINLGLGTITNVLLEQRHYDPYLADDLHCDMMRIFLETTFIGLFFLVNKYFNITKNDMKKFVIMIFSFLVMFSSHILTTFIYWIYVYMIFGYFNQKNKKKGV